MQHQDHPQSAYEGKTPVNKNIFWLYDYVFGEKAKMRKASHLVIKKTVKNTSPEEATKKMEVARQLRQQEKRRDFQHILQAMPKVFRAVLRQLGARELEELLFDNSTDDLSIFPLQKQYVFPDSDEIKAGFIKINSDYGYFADNDQQAIEAFVILSRAYKLYADYIERITTESNEEIALQAYKMMVWFGVSKEKIQEYLNQHVPFTIHYYGGDTYWPIFHKFKHPLPKAETINDLTGWRTFIQKYGEKGLILFQQKTLLENELKRAPKSLEETHSILAAHKYNRYSEDPALAGLCQKYDLSEDNFNQCLEIKKQRKITDNLPEACIQDKINPHYYLVKLPIDDPHAYLLGKVVNDCQSIGNRHGEQCTIDAITRRNNGFYVLLKDNKKMSTPLINGKINYRDFDIVGKGYAWLSKAHNFVFDSWDNLRPEADNPVAIRLLTALGEQITASGVIMMLAIGFGGKTPKEFNLEIVPEEIMEGVPYMDSRIQQMIFLNEKTQQQKLMDTSIKKILEKHLFLSQEELILLMRASRVTCVEQMEKIHNFFMLHDAKTLRELLFNGIPGLIEIIKKSPLQFWTMISLLMKTHQLSKDHFQFICHSIQLNPEENGLLSGFELLAKEKCLTAENFTTLLLYAYKNVNESQKNIRYIAGYLTKLDGKILNDSVREFLIQTKNPDSFTAILLQLDLKGIKDFTCKTLLNLVNETLENSKAASLIGVLGQLSKISRYNDYLPLITEKKPDMNSLHIVLFFLSEHKLLLNETITEIVFNNLDKVKMMSENIKFLSRDMIESFILQLNSRKTEYANSSPRLFTTPNPEDNQQSEGIALQYCNCNIF